MQVDRVEVLEILRQCHIFHRLTDEQLESVTDRVEAFLYEEKQAIFEQGSASDGFFFVVSGRVRLGRTRKKAEDFAFLESHDYFGEEALLFNRPRSATITGFDPSADNIITENMAAPPTAPLTKASSRSSPATWLPVAGARSCAARA